MSSRALTLWLGAALPLAIILALALGAVHIPPADVARVLWDGANGAVRDQATVVTWDIIIREIRLPRVLLAAAVGAVLATCGAATQGLFRNPLADPSLIGVTAGAVLGASLVIALPEVAAVGEPALGPVSAGAFAGGALAVILVYRLARSPSGTSVATMLLAGIAITALAGAVGSFLEFFSDSTALRRISLWRMGGLDGADYPRLGLAAGAAALVLIVLPRFAHALDALLLGESDARHLGVDVGRTTMALVVLVAIGVGATVALAGAIAFVGLVVPHVVRMLSGPGHRALLRNSALGGACLLVLADLVARVLMPPTELPVGIVTAVIGAPFFILLLRRRGEYGWN